MDPSARGLEVSSLEIHKQVHCAFCDITSPFATFLRFLRHRAVRGVFALACPRPALGDEPPLSRLKAREKSCGCRNHSSAAISFIGLPRIARLLAVAIRKSSSHRFGDCSKA